MEEEKDFFKNFIYGVEDYTNIFENISDMVSDEFIISGSDTNINIWNYNTGLLTNVIKNERIIEDIFTCTENNLFFVIEHTGKRISLEFGRGRINMLCYNIKIYDIDTYSMVHNFSLDSENVVEIVISPDLKYFAKITFNVITIIKVQDKTTVCTIRLDVESQIVACFSYDSKTFLYSQIINNNNIILNSLNIDTFERGEINTTVIVSTLNNLQKILITRNKIILQLNLRIEILDLEGILLRSFFYDDITYSGYNTTINISPNDKQIVYGFQDERSDKYSIRLINLIDYSSTYILDSNPTSIKKIIFINNDILASSSQDKTIKIWDKNGILLKTLTNDTYVQTLSYLRISSYIDTLLLSSIKAEAAEDHGINKLRRKYKKLRSKKKSKNKNKSRTKRKKSK